MDAAKFGQKYKIPSEVMSLMLTYTEMNSRKVSTNSLISSSDEPEQMTWKKNKNQMCLT